MAWRLRGRQSRDSIGRFSSSGGSGGTALGGLRGIKARSRLGAAISKARDIKSELKLPRSERGFTSKQLTSKLSRAKRAIALHKREVARVEKRGLVKVGLLKRIQQSQSLKLSRSELKGVRQDRVFFARQSLSNLRAKAKTFKRGEVAPQARSRMAKRLLTARRAVRNRKRELARLG